MTDFVCFWWTEKMQKIVQTARTIKHYEISEKMQTAEQHKKKIIQIIIIIFFQDLNKIIDYFVEIYYSWQYFIYQILLNIKVLIIIIASLHFDLSQEMIRKWFIFMFWYDLWEILSLTICEVDFCKMMSLLTEWSVILSLSLFRV